VIHRRRPLTVTARRRPAHRYKLAEVMKPSMPPILFEAEESCTVELPELSVA